MNLNTSLNQTSQNKQLSPNKQTILKPEQRDY